MRLLEMKKKALALIEELNPDSKLLTDDPDISAKINEVVNQIMYDLARVKKISKYVELEVHKGDLIDFEMLAGESGYEIYQIGTVGGVNFSPRANGTILKMLEDGTAEIDVFVYPERITEKTKDSAYEFELSDDALEIMPYGIAADLLASDVSANYGNVYLQRYEAKKQMLDPRYKMTQFTVEGGVHI
ncbi:MAG: hypothetical protein J6C89_06025 [Clostridia bacterium]|nr:hypothetical protein [Clostridia bacterium]